MSQAKTHRTENAGDVETLTRLNLEYIRSVDHRDIDWFDRHLSADFLNANPDCSIVERADFLKQIARGAGVSNIEAEDVRIKVIGNLGLIQARTSYKKPDGAAGRGRYTDIWVLRQGHWLCVSAHFNRF